MSEADAALAAGEWEALDKVAHTVKGNSLAAGDQQMADTAIALRNAAKLQERDQAGQLIRVKVSATVFLKILFPAFRLGIAGG